MDSIASKVSNLSHLRQLHAQLITNSLHHLNRWGSLLIARCTRHHAPPSYTRLIFDAVPRPDIHVLTAMFKYYTNAHLGTAYFEQAVSLYRRMQSCNARIVTFVYPVLIKSAGEFGFVLHAHVLKLGLGCDQFVRSAVMGIYAKYGPVESARYMFDEILERRVVDWNSMISGYWKLGNEAEACRLFDMMPERTVVTWTCMVTGYAKMKNLVKARDYFEKMPDKNVVSWNAMLAGYAHNWFAEEVLGLFDDMMNSKVQPNETTWMFVISACSSRGDPVLADSLVRKLNDKQVRLSYTGKTALIDMYARCGRLRTARNFFDDLRAYRNSYTWNVMISAYTRVGELNMARELFDKMPGKNLVSWNSMIAGYAQNEKPAMAIELFKDMIATEKSLKPNEVTMNHIKLSISGYNALIFMYSKCGSLKDAKRVFQEMAAKDLVSYRTLIAGFAAHGLGMDAVLLLSKMKEEGIEPNRATYIGVLTACSHAGLLEEGLKVFDSIKDPEIDHYMCLVELFGRAGKLDEAGKFIERLPKEQHPRLYESLQNASSNSPEKKGS
ncbi:Tetratricopeptide-like helical domain containing protein [Trema orientale]|uniref:Tetratricopeptide-like helical domain containing protein n=1 Tax=Trema orientale TaxID=63057 RepID=A0A2P5E5R7_TREOI|nr:Tetratricopeptide-like helical domain containing protein [Trema orientale]